MPSVSTLVIGVLLVLIACLLVALLVSQQRTRQAVEDAAELPQVLGGSNQDLEDLLQQLRKGLVSLARASAQAAVEDTGAHIVHALTAPAGSQYEQDDPGYTDGDPSTAMKPMSWMPNNNSAVRQPSPNPGARAQLAARANRPLPEMPQAGQGGYGDATSYQVVGTGALEEVLVNNGYPTGTAPLNQTAEATRAPSPDAADTAIFSRLGPDGETVDPNALPERLAGERHAEYLLRVYGPTGEPPEFHTSRFQRQAGESEAGFAKRVEELTELYNEWLDLSRVQTTSGFSVGIGYTEEARAELARY